MSTTEIVNLPSNRPAVTQTTAVEQSRAVAEVQAAIFVAQQFPRDMRRVWDDVRDACGRLALANRAFYAVKNRGSGPSVHLARAIVRIYGNADYGVRELSRDDAAGMSEIQSFAWDQQTNVRSTRTFQVPHQRMKDGKRQPLVDLGDVYLNNQNVGARAVRECVASILPTDLWEEAQRLCRETVERGDGKPLVDRINEMVKAFGNIGVTVAQMEIRLDRRRREWTGADVGQMIVAYQSIQNGDAAKDDLFPPAQRTTAADIVGASKAASVAAAEQVTAMIDMLATLGLTEHDDQIEYVCGVLGDSVESLGALTARQSAAALSALTEAVGRLNADA